MPRAQPCARHLRVITDQEELLVNQLRNCAKTFADSCVGRIAFDVVQRVLLEEFVVCAYQRQLLSHGERATQAQVGWLTGIGPENVRSVLNRAARSPIANQPLGVAERVLWLWRSDTDYLEQDGVTPARLHFLGGRGTFQGLVCRVVRGITPQTALNGLIARGWVECIDAHWVRLTRAAACVRIGLCAGHGGSEEASPPPQVGHSTNAMDPTQREGRAVRRIA